jgi:poly(beta-D-mannuronate) lyase
MEYQLKLSNLSSMMSILKAGDKVLLFDEVISNLNLNISSKGELLKRITIQPLNPGKVIVTGRISLIISGRYTTIANIIFKDGGNPNSIILKGYGNRLTGFDINLNNTNGPIIMVHPKNNRIDHCYIHDFTKSDRWIQKDPNSTSEDFFLFDHNFVKNRKQGDSNGFETLQLRNEDNKIQSKSIITQNYFENCDGEIELISIKSSDNIISNNTIDQCKGTITLRSGFNNIIVNNKFIQSNLKDAGGVRITGEGHIIKSNLFSNIKNGNTNGAALSIMNGTNEKPTYQQVKNLIISNNLFMENECDIVLGLDKYNLKPINIQFTGNVFFKSDKNPVFSNRGSKCDKVVFTNNRFFVQNIGDAPDDYGKIENFKTFDKSLMNTDLYGVTNKFGLNWNTPVEETEILIEINELYIKLKSSLLI